MRGNGNSNFRRTRVIGVGNVDFNPGEILRIRNGNGHVVERIEVGDYNANLTALARKDNDEVTGVFDAVRITSS